MIPLTLELHPRAVAEIRAARRWYARRSPAVAGRFMAELDHAVMQITTAPAQWPLHLHGTRFYRLRRFPFLVIFLELPNSVLVVALAHGRRRPGYWKRRL